MVLEGKELEYVAERLALIVGWMYSEEADEAYLSKSRGRASIDVAVYVAAAQALDALCDGSSSIVETFEHEDGTVTVGEAEAWVWHESSDAP